MLYEKSITTSPMETLEEMLNFFQIVDEEDVEEFYKLLPEQVKQEVNEDYDSRKRSATEEEAV